MYGASGSIDGRSLRDAGRGGGNDRRTLVGRVHASGADRARRKPPSSLDAYDHMLRGNALPWDDPASAAEAKRAFERAIEIDPGDGLPHSLLAVLLC
jgi:adenylate cyclase